MCTTWVQVDKSENEELDEEKESLSFFMALSTEVTNLNWKFDNVAEQVDMPSYDKQLFRKLHNDMTSLFSKQRISNWKSHPC